MGFKGHRPFEYMTKSFKDVVYSTLERCWSSAYGKTWKKKYDTIIPAMTHAIRDERDREQKKGHYRIWQEEELPSSTG